MLVLVGGANVWLTARVNMGLLVSLLVKWLLRLLLVDTFIFVLIIRVLRDVR